MTSAFTALDFRDINPCVADSLFFATYLECFLYLLHVRPAPSAGDSGTSGGYATPALAAATASAAAPAPGRIAPSIQPHMTAELTGPAQWARSRGSGRV